SILLQFTVTRYIYSSYEAVPVKQQFYHSSERFEDDEESEKEYEKYHPPRLTTRQLPLPVVGNLGWFFLSFSPFSTLISILSLALLYIPFTIFVMSFFESMGSLDVSLKRDYGPLFVCTLMSWAAAHLPLVIAGFVFGKLMPDGVPGLWLLGAWAISKLYFGALMVCAARTVFGTSFVNAIATI